MKARFFALVLLGLASCAYGALRSMPAQRGMTVDDVLSIETLGTIALSPDGLWAAVSIQRARRNAGFQARTRLGGDDRADVWLVSTSTGERRSLTDGAKDGSGWWAPGWSPDGEHLAMLSSRGGDNARIYVWSRRTQGIRRATDHGVHVGASIATRVHRDFGYAWADNTTLLTVAMPDGYSPFDFVGDQMAQASAPRAWKRMEGGCEPSVSVIVSGPTEPPRFTVATAGFVDIVKGRTTPLAEVRLALLTAPQLILSPDGSHLAIIESLPAPVPSPQTPMSFADGSNARLGLIRVGAKPDAIRWLDSIGQPNGASTSWSPDGRILGALGGGAVWTVDSAGGTPTRATPVDWRVKGFMWQGTRPAVLASVESSPRDDWWLDAKSNLTASLPEPPRALARAPDGALYGVASSDLWRIAPSGEATNLTASFAPAVRRIVSPVLATELVMAAGNEGAAYRISLGDGRIEVLSPPSAKARIDAHWPSQRSIVWKATEENGQFAWTASLATGRMTRLVAINEHLAGISSPRREVIEVRGADGATLTALALLPHDYEAGRRYPVLTWIYGGTVYRPESRPLDVDKYFSSSLNLLPVIGRGYVLLLPSIPLPPEGAPADPMMEIPKSVMGAVDRLVELGIADPDRLAVGGHSFGGYSTYSVIVHTHRFKAAIACAGPSNLATNFGTLDPRFRYEDGAGEARSQMRWTEGGQGRMGAPPWADLGRYARNSPVNFVDRVKTPVLIIHGDADFVSITQGEEFFSALHRQGKPARFARYWGESHSVESPANIAHMWGEILAWLDRHIGRAR